MLFGQCPFGRGADNPLSLFEAIQSEDLFPLPLSLAADPEALAADADALALLAGLLTKDPEARLSLEAAVAHPFFRRSEARRPFPQLDFEALPEFSNPEIARLEWEAGRNARQQEQQRHLQREAEAAQAALAAELLAPASFSDGEGDEGHASPALPPADALRPASSKRGSIIGFLFLGSAAPSPAPAAAAGAASSSRISSRDNVTASAAARPPLTSSSTAGRSSSALSPSGVVAAEESAPSAPAGVTLEGWLYKRGRTVRSWRRRFFRLCGFRLEYWESDPRTAPGTAAVAESAAGGGRGAADAASSSRAGGSSRSVGGGSRASSFFGSFSRSRSGSSLPAAAVDAALAASSSPSSPATHVGPAPRGCMDLSPPLTVSRLDGASASAERRFRFCIATSARELQLRAESEADEGAWIAAFDALAGGAARKAALPGAAVPEG